MTKIGNLYGTTEVVPWRKAAWKWVCQRRRRSRHTGRGASGDTTPIAPEHGCRAALRRMPENLCRWWNES